jgi:hypothetical protein
MYKQLTLLALFVVSMVEAKIDLVTVPVRDAVQVTIYNSADLTLVNERRNLTLREGNNRLQFSWANTLIDPTSLSMRPLAHAADIEVDALVFPPRIRELGLWNVRSEVSGDTPMEIGYLTSGLSWRAFYMGTLNEDESKMRLQGYVRVTNNSGEDYENAHTRLIVGKVHLLDEIATLARRPQAYGSPVVEPGKKESGIKTRHLVELTRWDASLVEFDGSGLVEVEKQIRKEGLSEYFLYTLDGTETIPDGWSKRLPSFDTADVPVMNLYKYEEEKYLKSVVRFLSFKNDEAHHLGDTPIPGGAIRVFRNTGANQHLSYEGQSSFKYIPVEEDVELNLGPVGNVTVVPTLMEFKTGAIDFQQDGNVGGWDEIRTFRVVVKNTRSVAVKVQVDRNFSTSAWSMTHAGDFGEYQKIDLDTVRFNLALGARTQKEFTYVLTTRHGTRAQQTSDKKKEADDE